jgi:succinate-semialdehyde dehydrogenase/glutarate-semialdehyde dehydrogenase
VSVVRNPRTGEPIGTAPLLSAADLPALAARAEAGFADWSTRPVAERCRVVAELARLLADRSAEIGRRFGLETGKTEAEAEAELDRAVETLCWYAEIAEQSLAGYRIAAPGLDRSVRVEPAGPVLAIVPSNFPAVVLARKVGPALLAGCSVVVKAPETAPSVVAALVELAHRAGVPEAVLQTAFSAPADAAALVARPEFRVISFTGSTRTGRLVAAGAAGTLAQCVLELGGSAPVIVAADADLAAAVPALVRSKFGSAGQSCAAPSRFLVQHDRVAEFVERFAAAVPALEGEQDAAGRPGTLGPLHTASRQAEVHELVTDAVGRGARLVTGGRPADRPGYYYPATVLADVPADARVLAEEPFGPLVPVLGYADEDEAVRLANSTPYGLGAFVFGEPARMRELAGRLEAGRVSINCATGADPQSPLGGRADSGYGYEGGVQGLLAFTRLKVVHEPATG